MRRQGTRGPERRDSSRLGQSLILAGMTFTRAATKVALISAPTTGAVAFVQTFGSGVLASENRGDGAGALVLLEAAFTNAIFQSRDAANAAWSGVIGAPTKTANAGPGIDGGTTAARIQATSAQATYQARASGVGVGNPQTWSAWVRRFSTGGDITIREAAGTDVSVHDAAATTTYERLAATANSSGGAENSFSCDGRPFVIAQDMLGDFYQLEAGRYPHSVIATAGATATCPADSLTGVAPQWMLASAWTIPQVSPIFANTDLVSGDKRILASFVDATNVLQISHDGTDVRVRAFVGGVEKAKSQALTFAKHALLGPVRVDPLAGLVYVNGTAGPAGTAWAWPAGNLRVGGPSGGSGNELDGRVSAVWVNR